jgi:hypothetical protein
MLPFQGTQIATTSLHLHRTVKDECEVRSHLKFVPLIRVMPRFVATTRMGAMSFSSALQHGSQGCKKESSDHWPLNPWFLLIDR